MAILSMRQIRTRRIATITTSCVLAATKGTSHQEACSTAARTSATTGRRRRPVGALLVNMRLLAFLLITTEIFILFNSAYGGLVGAELGVDRDDLQTASEQDGGEGEDGARAAAVSLPESRSSYTLLPTMMREAERGSQEKEKEQKEEEEGEDEVIKAPWASERLRFEALSEPDGGRQQLKAPAAANELALDHRSSAKLATLDDNVVSSSDGYNEDADDEDEENRNADEQDESQNREPSLTNRLGSRTNPLIESASASGANDNIVHKHEHKSRQRHKQQQQQHQRKKKTEEKERELRKPHRKYPHALRGFEHKHEQLARRLRLPPPSYNNQAKNVLLSPLFGDENHKRASMTHLRHKYDWWCHRDCNINSRRRAPEQAQQQRQETSQFGRENSICASDGRLYSSVCELRRQACLHNVHLFEMPALHCSPQMNGGNATNIGQEKASSAPANGHINGAQIVGAGQATQAASSAAIAGSSGPADGGGEEVRIVELKRRCNRIEYEDMKLLLLREFNGDTSSMFKYFDWNGDGFIEAHELWPRRNVEANKLMYAQVWDEHSAKCPQRGAATIEPESISAWPSVGGSNSPPLGGSQNNVGQRFRLVEGQSKCWFFLDFAFEPQHAPNPCSLSHLMLFDLQHPNSRFNLDTFEQAFSAGQRNHRVNYGGDVPANIAPAGGGVDKHQQHNMAQTHRLEPTKRFTRLSIGLGETVTLSCLFGGSLASKEPANFIASEMVGSDDYAGDNADDDDTIDTDASIASATASNNRKCYWSRYNSNLAALQDPHISIEERTIFSSSRGGRKQLRDLALVLEDAQLYLSGQFKCSCHHSKKTARYFEHIYTVNVLAEPRVSVRPHFQWSLPNSRISFECHYDYIDASQSGDLNTGYSGASDKRHASTALQQNGTNNEDASVQEDNYGELGQFGLRVKWLKNNQELIVDSKQFSMLVAANSEKMGPARSNKSDATIDVSDAAFDSTSESVTERPQLEQQQQVVVPSSPSRAGYPSEASLRASVTMASSRLTLGSLQSNDTGEYTCRVEVPATQASNQAGARRANHHVSSSLINGKGHGTLLVQEQPRAATAQEAESSQSATGTYLWMFHDNGISIYKLQNDDGQEMELVYEFNGHSLVSAQVDGNWNQLTLCGGLNPEQVVICEWSDNALRIDVKHDHQSKARKYIYVGQPNLNRIIVMDGLKFEIVAIINTEPQPRKLHLYKPSKIHLSKWVRHRLSPTANARFLATIGTNAHPLKLTPDSKLYSTKPLSREAQPASQSTSRKRTVRSNGNGSERLQRQRRFPSSTNQMPSTLIQYDIWLLCYGQPLIVDPAGDEHFEDPNSFYSATFADTISSQQAISANGSAKFNANHKQRSRIGAGSTPIAVQPFTPRLTAGPSFAWSIWPNKEAKLRNRKSVHIIQSTFFPQPLTSESVHNHEYDGDNDSPSSETGDTSTETPRQHQHQPQQQRGSSTNSNSKNNSVVEEFKRTTVMSTHHVFAGFSPASPLAIANSQKAPQRYLNGAQFDLIQDLTVPPKPYSLETNEKHKIHYAYVTHYDDKRLFRVSMDEYRYDKEIDLQNCDPINLLTTAQGLLVVQCRAPITHNLVGQLVLDQLTSSRLEFNANIRAQESYISPDNRYLVSIYSNSTTLSSDNHSQRKRSAAAATTGEAEQSTASSNSNSKRKQSIIYVQLVTVSGLRLQYEIKTSLEISQCSFVWKDGYYAAIFVSTNRRDQQSEILSLRLADSRLELMARVPGLISVARHKDQLVVSPELRLAALSTNQGTYVVDLEDNRVSQSLRHHQSSLTLLWV